MVMENFIFYSSLAYNVVLNKLAIRNWYDRIDQMVILGALPFRGKFSKLLIEEENVNAVISMNQDYELRMFSPNTDEWRKLGVEFLQLPTRDFVDVPSLEHLKKGVELIDKYSKLSHITPAEEATNTATATKTNLMTPSVYVHCKAGRTRSATLVACYLVKKHSISPEEAVEMIRSKRAHIFLTENHLNAIRNFQRSLSEETSI